MSVLINSHYRKIYTSSEMTVSQGQVSKRTMPSIQRQAGDAPRNEVLEKKKAYVKRYVVHEGTTPSDLM